MQVLSGPFAIAAVLLIAGGAPKLYDPAPTARAMRSAGLPAAPVLARMLGAAELVVGAYALIAGGRLGAALVACAYAGFLGFLLVVARRSGAAGSCGCFGSDDTPPSVVHGVVDGLAAVVAIAAIAVPPQPFWRSLAVDGLGAGAVMVILVAAGSWLGYLALSVLPTVIPREEGT